MNLIDLLHRHRRSEPTILLGLKLFTMIVFIACLTGYLAVVIIDVKQDAPIIKTSYINVDAVPPPSLHIYAGYNFSISGCTQYYFGDESVECSPEDTEIYSDQSNKIYFATYSPSPNIFFSNSSLSRLFLILTVNEDFTPDKSQDMFVHAFDSEYDIYGKNSSEYSTYDNSIYTLNSYAISPGQYDLSYSRIVRDLIISNWMDDFGVPPSYEQKSNIESILTGGPLPYGSEGYVISFSIKPKSNNVIRLDKEVRSKTYLSGLGLLGGAWGLVAAVYAFLFGADTLRPWGAVQSYCCGFSRLTKKELKKSLPTIPFFDTSSYNNFKNYSSDHELSLAEQIELRMNSLELFLQEYVVDVHYLDSIRDRLIIGSNTVNKLNDQGIQNMKKEFYNLNRNSTYSPESTVTRQEV